MKRRRSALARVLALALGLLLLLSLLSGCQAGANAVRVTLVLKTEASVAEFWQMLIAGVNAAAEEYGVELATVTSSTETAIDEQIALIEDVIRDHPDVMILSAADYERCAEVTERAIAAGIKVVSLDTDVNAAGRSCFVASNNYQIGVDMGAQMADFLPDGGKVAVIQHMTTTTSGVDRTQGALDELKKHANIEVLGAYCCENSIERAQSITRSLLREHPDIAGFVCTNEVCNVGTANTLVAQQQGGNVLLVGCDNSQRQIQFLEQNVIQAMVVQRPLNMGYIAVQQAVLLASGEHVDERIEVPVVTITRENMYTEENQKLLFPVTQ